MEIGQLNLLDGFNLFLCINVQNNFKLLIFHLFIFQSALAENLITSLPCCHFYSALAENEVLNIYVLKAVLKLYCISMVFIITCWNVKWVLVFLDKSTFHSEYYSHIS